MPGASDQLEVVRILADGTYMWREPLSAPGTGRSALLLNFLASDAVGSTEFEISDAGDWIATVAGVRYHVIPGVIPDTGRFVFIGVRAPVRAEPPPVIPPTTPPFNPKDYSDNFDRANGDPGSPWSLHTGGASFLSISGNELTATSANEQQLGYWIKSLPAGEVHHKVEVTIGTSVPTLTYLMVRANEADGHVLARIHDTGVVEILSCEGALIGGALTPRMDTAGIALAPGFNLSFEAVASDYIVRVNGVEVLAWDDSAVAWDHVDETHLNCGTGLNLASLKARRGRAGTGMSIDNFAITLKEYITEADIDALFAGDGALTATAETTPRLLPVFSGDGGLTATLTSTILANFSGDGALSTVVGKPYEDDFNRPDGPAGPDWTVWHDGGSQDLVIRGNELVTTNATNEQHGWWNRALPTVNHRVEVQVGTGVAAEYFLLVRAAASGGVVTSHVRARLFTSDGSVEMSSADDSGVLLRRASLNSSPPPVTGQVISFEAEDTEYILRVDESEILRWSDTAVVWPYVDDLHRNVNVGMQGTGSLDNFKATDLDAPTYEFTGEGALSATLVSPSTIPAALSGEGALAATIEEATKEPFPEFAAIGSLTAKVTTYPKPVSHWTFYEAAGIVARSLIAGYRLDLDAADGGWYGKALNGVAYGDPGAPGIMAEWSVALQLTYNSATPDGPAILENCYEANNTHFSVGFDKRGGAAYPGVWVETAVAGSNWVWSTTPIPLGVPHTLVCTCSVSDATVKLYLDGVEILSVGGQTLIHRDFVNGTALFDRTYMPDAYLDELTYWDSCLTPTQVAGLPPAVKMPVSDFDFRERGGPTAASLTGSYTLAASDPVTAWDNAAAVAPFTGVVATGVQNEWTVALDLTLAGGAALTSGDGLRAIMSLLATGTSILESAAENVIGLNHASGYAYPGLQVAGGAWEYSGVPVPLGSLHKLVCVGSVAGAATVLYLDGMPILTVAGATARNFATAATLLDDQNVASVDNVAYWDIAMTPDQVAALPPLGPSRYTPISNFDFREAGGPTAASTRGAYVLAATDPATAWAGQEAKGEFTGVVGAGYLVAWSAAYTITINALGTTDEIIEDCYDNIGTRTFALAVRYTGGAAYPGFFTTQAGSGAWAFSTTPIPAGIQYTLVFVSDPAAASVDSDSKLYLNGGLIATAEYSTYRQLDQPTLLMGPSRPDASIDNVTYWDIALTPAEVLDIPKPIDPAILPKEITAQFSGDGTLTEGPPPPLVIPDPIAHFDFHEMSGATTTSTIGAQTLTATDPTNAWVGQQAAKEFKGILGLGVLQQWTVAMHMIYRSVGPDGPTILESSFEDTVSHSSIGINEVGGVGYPGVWAPDVVWEYSTTPLSVDVPHTIVLVGDNTAGTLDLYVDGAVVLALTGQTGLERDFDSNVEILDATFPQDAYVDNLIYWDGCLTPDEVAALPPAAPPYDLYRDDFERPNGELGPNWTVRIGWPADPPQYVDVLDGEMRAHGDGEVFADWNTPLPGDDHKVEVTVGRHLGVTYELEVRHPDVDGQIVYAQFMTHLPTGVPPGNAEYMGPAIITADNWAGTTGGQHEVAQAPFEVITSGQKLSFEAVGQDYISRIDGREVNRWTDTGAEKPVSPTCRRVTVRMTANETSGYPDVTLDNFQALDSAWPPDPNWPPAVADPPADEAPAT